MNPSYAFSTLHVWHHNFFVSHSILMILDAQKSRDHPLPNGSKNINFRRGKYFSGRDEKKCCSNYETQFIIKTTKRLGILES